jgi:hypothetical protein
MPANGLIESSAYAYLVFLFTIPIQIPQQLKPQPTEIIQIPERMRMLPQKPILMIHQTIQQPKLIPAKTRPDKVLASPNIFPNQPYAPPITVSNDHLKHVSAPNSRMVNVVSVPFNIST